MLKDIKKRLLKSSQEHGWVLEPDAKDILQKYGIEVPIHCWATSKQQALSFAAQQGYPLVLKVVSPQILHKTDIGGVQVGITSDDLLVAGYEKMSGLDGFCGVLVEEMVEGVELFAGAKIDYQFGPVIIMGLGGMNVEIYQDTAVRMAPIKEKDVISMARSLKSHKLLEGFRGARPVKMEALIQMFVHFSKMVIDLQKTIDSIDLNPVFCDHKRCVVADARILFPDDTY